MPLQKGLQGHNQHVQGITLLQFPFRFYGHSPEVETFVGVAVTSLCTQRRTKRMAELNKIL